MLQLLLPIQQVQNSFKVKSVDYQINISLTTIIDTKSRPMKTHELVEILQFFLW
jgi:hypothetical protein